MSECAGVTTEARFQLIMRTIEKMWRQGFEGSMVLDFNRDGHVKFRHTQVWQPGDESGKPDT